MEEEEEAPRAGRPTGGKGGRSDYRYRYSLGTVCLLSTRPEASSYVAYDIPTASLLYLAQANVTHKHALHRKAVSPSDRVPPRTVDLGSEGQQVRERGETMAMLKR